MKSLFISLVLFILLVASLHAQNLVPNPSFELLKTTPSCNLSVPKAQFESIIHDWEMPTDATPDLYSTLMPSNCLSSQPNGTVRITEFPAGHQLPRTGNIMAGLAPYISPWYREYLAVKLTSPLVVGERYCCRMYVSLAEGSKYAQANLAMYFSDVPVYQPTAPYLNFSPQVVNFEAITDSIEWIEYKGSFKAQSPAQYLIIGNFDIDARDGQLYIGPDSNGVGYANFAYYYIDDVSVEPLNPPALTITGNEKVCPGTPLQLQASGWENIRWYNHLNQRVSNNEILNITHAKKTSYTVKGYHCNALLSQKVPIEVHPVPKVKLGQDRFMCPTNEILLDANAGFNTYLWQDGSTLQTFLVQHAGIFHVKVSNTEGCFGSDSIVIYYYPKPYVNLGHDIETCTPSGTLNASQSIPFISYRWQDGSTREQFQYHQAGTYWVNATNPCSASDQDTITIHGINLFIPNLITPNGDGLNDEFIIKGLQYSTGVFEVYNSFGTRVYQNKHYENNWSGEGLSDGIYYYSFKHPQCEVKKGWIHIIK